MRFRRILLTGAGGQVGWELARALPALGETIALGRERLDLADPAAVRRTVRDLAPDLVVNAGAYTAVDRAELEPELAHAVNAVAPGVLAEEARRCGAVLIHYSTDYVFDGEAGEPYAELAATKPINVYGRSKLAGEQAIAASGASAIVLRTSWVYGLRGRNFLLTMRRLAAERSELRVVDDQIGTPNWSRVLAESTVAVVDRAPDDLAAHAGVYHLSCSGRTSWCGFARAIVADLPGVRVVPIATADYPTPARRPRFSVLDGRLLATTFSVSLPSWEYGLQRCLTNA